MAPGPCRCRTRRRHRHSRRRRHRCHRHRHCRSHHHTPKASSWLPSQSQSPAGMSEHPHSYIAPGPLQMPHSSFANAVVDVVTDAIGIGVARSRHPHAQGVELVSGRSRSPAGMSGIRTRRWRQGRCRCRTPQVRRRSRRRLHASASASLYSRHHAPRAASWLPSGLRP